jgi:hypothetical protein
MHDSVFTELKVVGEHVGHGKQQIASTGIVLHERKNSSEKVTASAWVLLITSAIRSSSE